jgi:hypothetical protein
MAQEKPEHKRNTMKADLVTDQNPIDAPTWD